MTPNAKLNLPTDNAELNPDDSLKDIVEGDSAQLNGIVDSWEVGRMDDRVGHFVSKLRCHHGNF